MSLFSPFHLKLIASLVKNEVRFIVVGGFAVIYYGVSRGTGDLDLLVEPTRSNGERVLKAFRELGLSFEDLDASDFENAIFLAFGFEPDAVDVLTITPGIDYATAHARANQFSVSPEMKVKIIHIDDLIANKTSLNRQGAKALLDQYDVQELVRIKNQKSENRNS